MMRLTRNLGAALLALSACSGPTETGANNTNNTNDGKGDTPTVRGNEACELREADVLNTGKPRFLRDFIRWPAGDVEGVNTVGQDSRGQEYTEYFAVVMSPNEAGSALGETGAIYGIPLDTPLAVPLNDDQLFWLEDNGSTQVGSCVFTSWHQDVTDPLPCEKADGGCPTIHGVPITADRFRMRIPFNSNNAASDLVQRCYGAASSKSYGTDAPASGEFFRGCMLVADLYGTEWRASDPQICASAMRLAECGCHVTADPNADLALALIPSVAQQQQASGGTTLRGFPLGTWSAPDALPLGCEYVSVGPELNGVDGRNFVACSITAADLLQNRDDPKEFCRQKYGPDVVVHVPIPADALTCTATDGTFAETCQTEPWVVRQMPNAAEPAGCCRVCTTGKACGDSCIAAAESCTQEPGCACDG